VRGALRTRICTVRSDSHPVGWRALGAVEGTNRSIRSNCHCPSPPQALARGYLYLCRFFTAAVWCVPALGGQNRLSPRRQTRRHRTCRRPACRRRTYRRPACRRRVCRRPILRRENLPPPRPPPSRRTHCRPAVFAEPAAAQPQPSPHPLNRRTCCRPALAAETCRRQALLVRSPARLLTRVSVGATPQL
jgi:hypothetical protein